MTLQKKVDRVLVDLQKDGTMKQLSQKYFGGDFIPKTADMSQAND